MATYELSTNLDYWGPNVTQDIADRAAEIGKQDIEEAFADEGVEVEITPGDGANDLCDALLRSVYDYVQDFWVDWLSQADTQIAATR